MFEPPEFPFKEITNIFKEQLVEDGTSLFANEQVDDTIATSEITSTSITTSEDSQDVNFETLQITNDMLGEHQIIMTELDLNKASSTDEDGVKTHYILLNSNEIVIGNLEDSDINEYIIKDGDSSTSIILHQCQFCTEVFTDVNELWTHTLESHAVVTETEIIETNAVQSDQENNALNIVQQNEECTTEDATVNCTICKACNRILAIDKPLNEICPICCKGTTDTSQVQRIYSCEKCDTYFTIRPSALLSHQAACRGSENHDPNVESSKNLDTDGIQTNYLCNNCCHVCSSKEELSKHVSSCTVPVATTKSVTITGPSSKMWNCGSCNQLFATARELYQHKRGEDRQPGSQLTTYICEECDKVFGSVCALHTHLKTHIKVKPGYPCKVCGRRFNQSGHLAIHMRMHTGERPYPCDLCTKAFKVKVERDDHRRTHTGERPFACTVCEKTFTAAARLREHSRIHTDQRPYRCSICGAAFRRPYARTVHTLIHTGQKPHECNICGTSFRRSGDMWKHKRTLHGIMPALKAAANQRN